MGRLASFVAFVGQPAQDAIVRLYQVPPGRRACVTVNAVNASTGLNANLTMWVSTGGAQAVIEPATAFAQKAVLTREGLLLGESQLLLAQRTGINELDLVVFVLEEDA